MVRMEYQEVLENEDNYTFIATFEDNYLGNEIFFYEIEKQTKFFLLWHVASPCYILERGEPMYIGPNLFSLNERDIDELHNDIKAVQ